MLQRFLFFSVGVVLFAETLCYAQDDPLKQIGLTQKEVLDGWIAVYDRQTTFGLISAAHYTDGEHTFLQRGKTATEFADVAVKARIIKGGILICGGHAMNVSPGTVTLTARGKRGPIELGPGVAVEALYVRPLDLPTLFNGKDLDNWQVKFNPKLSPEKRAKWFVEKGAIRALGGPGALEFAPSSGKQLFGDFIAQIVVRTRAEHTNGGFFFRNQPGTVMMGYEAQIHNKLYDLNAGQHGWSTGAIDDRQHARKLVAVDHQPFLMTVVAHGAHIATWVNGYQTTNWTDPRPPDENPRKGKRVEPGAIQLQAHDPQTDLEFQAIRVGSFPDTLPTPSK